MARKSKGKFNMKGHSIPGIKGFKGSKLKDGRAASSAFQMQSPFNKTTLGDTSDLEWSDIDKQEYLANRASAQKAGQSGVDYGVQELIKASKRLKAKKEKEENPADVMEEKVEENTPTPEELAKENQEAMDKELENVTSEPDLSEHVKKMELPEVSEPDIQSYEGATKNEMYDLRRPFKDDGTWDPNNNPEHAAIQNKINELHGSSKRYGGASEKKTRVKNTQELKKDMLSPTAEYDPLSGDDPWWENIENLFKRS